MSVIYGMTLWTYSGVQMSFPMARTSWVMPRFSLISGSTGFAMALLLSIVESQHSLPTSMDGNLLKSSTYLLLSIGARMAQTCLLPTLQLSATFVRMMICPSFHGRCGKLRLSLFSYCVLTFNLNTGPLILVFLNGMQLFWAPIVFY